MARCTGVEDFARAAENFGGAVVGTGREGFEESGREGFEDSGREGFEESGREGFEDSSREGIAEELGCEGIVGEELGL